MKARSLVAAAAALALGTAIGGGAAQAATFITTDLTVDGCSAHCLAPPTLTDIGTVKVVDNGGVLDFTVTLDNGARFNTNDTKGQGDTHHGFVFDLATKASDGTKYDYTGLNINVTTSGFALPTVSTKSGPAPDPAPYTEAPFGGAWSNAIDYVGGGAQGSTPSVLEFEVSDKLNNLSLAMLAIGDSYVPNKSPKGTAGKNVEFAADVYSNNTTGGVGALYTDDVGDIPEPAAWALMIMGVAGVGGALRQKRRQALATA